MSRDSFVCYRSFVKSCRNLPDDIRLKVYEALFDYALDDEEPEEDGIVIAMLELMKPQIDANNRRYENGKKGGRKPKQIEANANQSETKTEPKLNQSETKAEPSENQSETKAEPKLTTTEPNVNVNDNVNVNVNDNEYINTNAQTDQWFDEFWKLYPRKASKHSAQLKFKSKCKNEKTFNAIMSGLQRFLPIWKTMEMQFIPHPSTWLNQERWNDEVQADHKPKTNGIVIEPPEDMKFMDVDIDLSELDSF